MPVVSLNQSTSFTASRGGGEMSQGNSIDLLTAAHTSLAGTRSKQKGENCNQILTLTEALDDVCFV